MSEEFLSQEKQKQYFKEIEDGKNEELKDGAIKSENILAKAKKAEENIYYNFRKLANKVAISYQNRGLEIEDLIQEGEVGLIVAIKKYNASAGALFSTYAHKVISQQITRAIDQKSRLVRLPVYQSETLRKLKAVEKQLEVSLGKSPTFEEIASAAAEGVEVVKELLKFNDAPDSLDAILGKEDSDFSNYSLLESPINLETDYEQKELKTILNKVILELSVKERFVLQERFALFGSEEKTLSDIAAELKLTKEAVRQIQLRVLLKLRKNLAIYDIKSYNY